MTTSSQTQQQQQENQDNNNKNKKPSEPIQPIQQQKKKILTKKEKCQKSRHHKYEDKIWYTWEGTAVKRCPSCGDLKEVKKHNDLL